MSGPQRRIELVAHDPAWKDLAAAYSARIASLIGETLVDIHHIGSTAIGRIVAKPIIDLMPVVHDLAAVDRTRPVFEAAGFEWRGEYGIPGRRYCLLEDPDTGRRLVHVHIFEAGSADIERHLAFRDYLRAHAEDARDYEAIKRNAAALHPNDGLAYNDAKDAWVKACEQRALIWRREGGPPNAEAIRPGPPVPTGGRR